MEIKSKEIAIELTNKCSASCVICPREKYTHPYIDMDWDLYTKIIDDASQYEIDILNTCGYGEVFLDRKLFDRLRYAKQKIPNAKVYVSSTCYQMDEKKYEDVLSCVDTLKISFYGMTKESYKANHRGSLKFDVSLNNILGFLEYKKDKSKKIYTTALLTVTDSNEQDVQPFINFWTPKVDEVMVWKPHNFAGGRDYRPIDREKQMSCGRPSNGPLIINADGTVSMCCFDYNNQLLIGDLKIQTLEEVLHSDAFNKIKEAHNKNNFNGLICENCCQTNYDTDVLVYASNNDRAVGKENSTLIDFRVQDSQVKYK